MGRRGGNRAPCLDDLQLRWREALLRLPWSGMRTEGSGFVRAGALLPVPSLLRARLREPAGERDVPGSSQGAIHTRAPRREREHDEAVPREAQGYALEDVRAALVGAPRGGDGAAYSHEGVVRQVREEGRIAALEGFVRQFLAIAHGNRKAIVVKAALASPC